MWHALLISHLRFWIYFTHIIPNLSSFASKVLLLNHWGRDVNNHCREVERFSLWRQFCSILNQTPFFKVQETTETQMPLSLFHFHAVFLSGILNCQGKNSPTLDHLGPSWQWSLWFPCHVFDLAIKKTECNWNILMLFLRKPPYIIC